MKRPNRRQMMMIATATLLLTGAGNAMASSTSVGYNTTVGKFNGSGYTGYVTKTTTNSGYVNSTSVGGDYTVDARMQNSNGVAGSWARELTDHSGSPLARGSIVPGNLVRIQFSNDLSTPVDVQVSGSWHSD